MNRKQKNLKLKVLFNASVVLSGLRSKKGGSGKLLELARIGKIDGIISEIVFDEVLKHSGRLGFTTATAVVKNIQIFKEILPAPDESIVKKCKKMVIDEGDAHVLASCKERKIKHLVTLDKKHLLVLKGKIKGLNILTPGELVEVVKENRILI